MITNGVATQIAYTDLLTLGNRILARVGEIESSTQIINQNLFGSTYGESFPEPAYSNLDATLNAALEKLDSIQANLSVAQNRIQQPPPTKSAIELGTRVRL